MKWPPKIFLELRQQIFFLFQRNKSPRGVTTGPENTPLTQFTKLSSGFFHELVNPLVAISLHIDELKNNNPHKDFTDLDKRITQAFAATKSLENFIQKIKEQLEPPVSPQNFVVNTEILSVIDILTFIQKREQTKIIFLASDEFFLFGNPVEFYVLIFCLLFFVLEIYHETPFFERKPISIRLTKNGQSLRFSLHAPDIVIPKRKHEAKVKLSFIKNTLEKNWKGKMNVLSSEKNGSKFDLNFPFAQ